MKKGRIIYLNGVTSTGKTSISLEMQALSEENYYYLSNDLFEDIVSEKILFRDYWHELFDAILAMYHVAKCLAGLGHNVIIDGMVTERSAYTRDGMTHWELIRSILGGERLYMVGITCPIEELRRRNVARGDRDEMKSDEQLPYMSDVVLHDLMLDSSQLSPAACAEAILRACEKE